jgi:hypothetical protein
MNERTRFVSELGMFSENERKEISAALIQLADRFTRAQEAVEEEEEGEAERVSFRILEDGRVIEQVTNPSRFVIYDPAAGSVTYSNEVEVDGSIYKPFESAGPVKLVDTILEYGSVEKLDEDIEAYIYRNVDLPDRDRKLAAKYARFSYITDLLLETPYLRPVGPSGNGKSRYVQTVGSICYRPLVVVSPSAASMYRLIDNFHCTLAIDEGNFADGGEDASELIKILNCGFQRGNAIPRVEPGKDGEYVVKTFDPFGPKLVASLKVFESQAFESRCIPAQMYETTRNDIKFRLSRQLLKEQEEFRAKLLLWRLRNCTRDFED